jgi:hypothetical protein
MSISAFIGERLYEFETFTVLTYAREMYAHCTGSQNEFEEAMENAGIDFLIGENP